MTGLDILLAELERQARNRARELALAGKLSPELERLYAPTEAEEREARRMYAALLAATSVAAFSAAAKGRPVPASLLDRELVPGGRR
ncbi:MAG: hypothetical protein IRZ05_13085 [Micromonosporaceae bacterium]|nr:hypothetical protein [Micromonosporaceae bacterium]